MQIDDLENYYLKAVEGIDENLLKDFDSWYQYVLQLPKHLETVYTILVLNQQVLNGGFHQYFYNPYGLFVYETIESLERIGAYKAKEMLQAALGKVNAESFGREEFRWKIFNREMDSLVLSDDDEEDYFSSLNNQYYLFEEDIDQLLVDYIEKGKFQV